MRCKYQVHVLQHHCTSYVGASVNQSSSNAERGEDEICVALEDARPHRYLSTKNQSVSQAHELSGRFAVERT